MASRAADLAARRRPVQPGATRAQSWRTCAAQRGACQSRPRAPRPGPTPRRRTPAARAAARMLVRCLLQARRLLRATHGLPLPKTKTTAGSRGELQPFANKKNNEKCQQTLDQNLFSRALYESKLSFQPCSLSPSTFRKQQPRIQVQKLHTRHGRYASTTPPRPRMGAHRGHRGGSRSRRRHRVQRRRLCCHPASTRQRAPTPPGPCCPPCRRTGAMAPRHHRCQRSRGLRAQVPPVATGQCQLFAGSRALSCFLCFRSVCGGIGEHRGTRVSSRAMVLSEAVLINRGCCR